MSQEKKVCERATNWRLIARVFLYIVGLNIVLRSDMWVSVCILMVVCIQLLPLLWAKKIRAYFSEENRLVIAEKVKGVIRRLYAAGVNAKAAQNAPPSRVNIILGQMASHHQADESPSFDDKAKAAPDDIFDDARFEDVWRDSDTK